MGSFRVLALAGTAAFMTVTAASAADMPQFFQPAMPVVQSEGEFSGWYLRGDVGAGIGKFRAFDHTATNGGFVWPASWAVEQKSYDDTFFIGGGIGYQWNSWLRFDVTGEYRMATRFRAVGSYSGAADFCAGGGKCFDVYDGAHSSTVVMANAYVDLGTWWRLTPFVGAGIGMAHHTVSGFWDLGLNSDGSTGRGFASNHSHWNMAWAVHAGVAYNVSHQFKVELAYRYLNMGSVRTGIIDCVGCGAGGPLAYYTLRNLDSHDIKLGLRWLLDAPPPPAPIMTKG